MKYEESNRYLRELPPVSFDVTDIVWDKEGLERVKKAALEIGQEENQIEGSLRDDRKEDIADREHTIHLSLQLDHVRQ